MNVGRFLNDFFESYMSIAFDVDNTLIGNNNNRTFFWNYIKNNRDRKLFHLVTFRKPNEVDNVENEMRRLGYLQSGESVFTIFYTVNFCTIPSEDPFYTKWKGFVCRMIGSELLVDDSVDLVKEGCKEHFIDLLDSKNLEFHSFRIV